jgi:hypothetical protein
MASLPFLLLPRGAAAIWHGVGPGATLGLTKFQTHSATIEPALAATRETV